MSDDYPYASPPDAKTWQPEWPPAVPPLASTEEGDLPPAWETAVANLNAPALITILGVALALCLPANAIIIPISELPEQLHPAMLIILAIGGAIAAEAALLTVLVVWGAGPLWRRLAWHWGLAAVLLLAWCGGWLWSYGYLIFQPANYRYRFDDARIFACGFLLFALLLQAMPWLLRIYLGWRILLPGATQGSLSERLSIRDLLVGTVVAALAVAAARAGRPEEVANGEYWLGWIGVGIGTVIFTVVAIVPQVYFVLGMRSVRWAIGGVVLLSAIVAGGFATFLLATEPSGGPPVWWILLAIVSMIGGYSGMLAGTLWVARAYGYRLVRGRVQSPDQWSG
jgi:hypothetical protein